MKVFYRKSILFWFVLLAAALLNAAIRETTYKPMLTPYIGKWAHQISSATGIAIFFAAIYYFLRRMKGRYTKRELLFSGLTWMAMTVAFETFMNYYVRKLTFIQVLETYYFWKGDTWAFVLLSLAVSPFIADRMLSKNYHDPDKKGLS